MALKGDTAILARKLDNISDKLCCLVNNGNSNACGCDCQPLMVDIGAGIDFGPVIDAITNLTVEIENNLTCSISKACNAGDCSVVSCKVCTDVEGVAVSTELYVEGVWIPDSEFTGTLDLACISCGEPVPTYDYEQIKVCFSDCTEGYSLIKINGADDTVSSLGVFNLDNTDASNKTIVPCQPVQTVSHDGYCVS